MRTIILEYSDYDVVSGESWFDTQEGYLVSPYVVFYRNVAGIGFLCFKEAIGADQKTVDTRQAKGIEISLSVAGTEEYDLAGLANMTVAKLGEILAAQIQ